jgi:hypothetical protein
MAVLRDLCKMPLLARFLRQAQILILKILNVFLRLKFSPSLNLNKNEHFSKVSLRGLTLLQGRRWKQVYILKARSCQISTGCCRTK